MPRFHGIVWASAILASGLGLSISAGGHPAAAAPFAGGSITSVCAGVLSGPRNDTYTLTGNCGPTTGTITIPPNITTVDGGGFTISATDPVGGFFHGSVLANAAAGQTMAITSMVIAGNFAGIDQFAPGMTGISFNDASGALDHVQLQGITRHHGCEACSGFGSTAIGAGGLTAARTVTITNTTVSGYDGTGLVAGGHMIMNVSASAIGPPDDVGFPISSVTYAGSAGGSISDSTINLGVFVPDSIGVSLSGANNVTISRNVIKGTRVDSGIEVTNSSRGVVIERNEIVESPPPSGVGVIVSNNPPTVTLLCNSFSGWPTNIKGALQISCTPLPSGTACHPYPSTSLGVEGGTAPYRWTVTPGGSTPPGLTLSASGLLSGTPIRSGAFTFTVMVNDSSSPRLSSTIAQTITIGPGCPTVTSSGSSTTTPTAPVAAITTTSVRVTG
jgi:hypothetical protein